MRTVTFLRAVFTLGALVGADVVGGAAHGFAVRSAAQMAAHPSRVNNVAIDLLGRWWNPAHTFSKTAAAPAPAVDAVLAGQRRRLKPFVETGRPE